jgi:hypothetical protein
MTPAQAGAIAEGDLGDDFDGLLVDDPAQANVGADEDAGS